MLRPPLERQRLSKGSRQRHPLFTHALATKTNTHARVLTPPPGSPAYEVLEALLTARAAAAAGPAAAGFTVSYTDAGLVGVTGTCSNGQAGAFSQALVSCFSVGSMCFA